MKRLCYAFLIICCCTFLCTTLLATHNRAGEITFRQSSSNTVEVMVTTYTKASSLPADRDTITLCWGDGLCERLARVNGNGELLPNDHKMNIYEGVHTYEELGEYTIYVQDPNRNGGILNVNFPNSDQIIFYIESTIDLSADNALNNSPILLERPIDIAYLGQTFIHVPNAFDLDDDSIAYELVTPMSGPGLEIPNYQPVDAISPGPNNIVSFNEMTGVLIWDAPQREGEYNIAILIKSYRNGVLIDQVLRDMQILVKDEDNASPIITADPLLDEIHEVPLGDTVSIALSMSDVNQQISVSSSCGLYDFFVEPAIFTAVEDGSTATATFEWVAKTEHLRTQPYQVAFKVADDQGLANYIVMRFKTVDQVSNTAEPQSKEIRLDIYPNPSTQTLTIGTTEAVLPIRYQVVNSNGQLLLYGKFESTNSSLDISRLPASTYFLRAWKGDTFVYKTFTVQK